MLLLKSAFYWFLLFLALANFQQPYFLSLFRTHTHALLRCLSLSLTHTHKHPHTHTKHASLSLSLRHISLLSHTHLPPFSHSLTHAQHSTQFFLAHNRTWCPFFAKPDCNFPFATGPPFFPPLSLNATLSSIFHSLEGLKRFKPFDRSEIRTHDFPRPKCPRLPLAIKFLHLATDTFRNFLFIFHFLITWTTKCSMPCFA